MPERSLLLFVPLALLVCTSSAQAQRQTQPLREFQLQPKSEAFWKLFDKDAKLQTIAEGFGFLEGPVWNKSGFVWVSDEVQNAIYRIYPDGHKETEIEMGNPDGSTLDTHGDLITTYSDARSVVRVDPGGEYTTLADKYEGKRLNSPNDLVVGPDGALYFTDPTLDMPKGDKQELDFQGIFRLDSKGALTLMTKEVETPNGLAFSPDGKRLYINDSKTHEVRVWDVVKGPKLTNGRHFATAEGRGATDGMRVDKKGNLWSTGPNGIWIWNSKGKHLGTIQLPRNAANLAWGDPDYGTLYITGTSAVYRLRTKAHGFVPWLKYKSAK